MSEVIQLGGPSRNALGRNPVQGGLLARFAAAILMLSASGSLTAQPVYETEPSTNIKRPAPARATQPSLTEEQRGRSLINQFARCLIDSQPKLVAEAINLTSGLDNPVYLKIVARTECLSSGTMRFSNHLIRGAIFAELYRRAYKGNGLQFDNFRVNPLDLASAPTSDHDDMVVNWFVLWMTSCLAEIRRAEMEAVLLSGTGTTAQNNAYARIFPALAPCVPSGQTFTLTRALLEAGFGEYLYRNLPAPVSGSGR